MKKRILVTMAIVFLFPVLLNAATVYFQFVPDPLGPAYVTGQEVWHDPDINVSGDEVVVWSGSATDTSGSFTFTGGDLPNDAVWHRTKYIGGAPDVDTTPIAPVLPSGAGSFILLQFGN